MPPTFFGGKKAAIATLAGDILKGVVAVLIARWLTTDPLIISLSMVGAFIGHLFPVFFGFKGGKGVATAVGAFIAANLWVGLALIATWLLMAFVTRYSSLSALVATALSPLYAWIWLGSPEYIVATWFIAVVLYWRHRSNIRHLMTGEENKIGYRPDAPDVAEKADVTETLSASDD